MVAPTIRRRNQPHSQAPEQSADAALNVDGASGNQVIDQMGDQLELPTDISKQNQSQTLDRQVEKQKRVLSSVAATLPVGQVIFGLDIGTSKVVAIAAAVRPDVGIEIIGVGHASVKGMKKGVVVDIESTQASISRAIEEMELMAGVEVDQVYVGVAGSHIQGINSHGVVAIQNREVSAKDIERVIDSAKAVPLSADQKILHVLPQEYIIDSQEGIKEPLGMSGVRLEAKVHLVVCATNAVENIQRCVNRCGLKVKEIVLEQLASSYAVLNDDEKELGVCLVDIGAGTTDIAVFTKGSIRHTAVIPIAGDQVTNDIAMAFRTASEFASDLKIHYGQALMGLPDSGETFEIVTVGDKPSKQINKGELAKIIEPRFEELLLFVKAELTRAGYFDQLGAGVVLTGGSAAMQGLVELAEEVFDLPVRLAIPNVKAGLTEMVSSSIFSTSVGLLEYASSQVDSSELIIKDQVMQLDQLAPAQYNAMHTGGFKAKLAKIINWIKQNF